LEQLGYHNKGEQGIAGRFAFRQRMDTAPFTQPSRLWQAHHLYVCFADSLALKNHLLFRDVLIRQPHLVAAYGQLKTALVNEKGMTRDKYTQRKTEFIVQILATHGLSTSEIEAIRMANQ
jgi:GrpB-like predicted nucleotidyltransferase (UPF0157 family)